MLGDEELLAVIEPLGKVIECHAHLGTDVGDEILIEHEGFASAAECVERPKLDRRQGGKRIGASRIGRLIIHCANCSEPGSRHTRTGTAE